MTLCERQAVLLQLNSRTLPLTSHSCKIYIIINRLPTGCQKMVLCYGPFLICGRSALQHHSLWRLRVNTAGDGCGVQLARGRGAGGYRRAGCSRGIHGIPYPRYGVLSHQSSDYLRRYFILNFLKGLSHKIKVSFFRLFG